MRFRATILQTGKNTAGIEVPPRSWRPRRRQAAALDAELAARKTVDTLSYGRPR